MALQGTLDTFALPDVLRLLAATRKSGRLQIDGDRGSGSTWVLDGQVTAVAADHAPRATDPAEALFELLRFESGSFTFDAEARPTADGGSDVEPLIERAEELLGEWREIEAVVPSLASWVALRPELRGDDVTVDAARWRTLVAVGSGATVAGIGEALDLGELPVSRAVRDLVELGVAEVEARAPEPVAAPVPAAAPAEAHERSAGAPAAPAEMPAAPAEADGAVAEEPDGDDGSLPGPRARRPRARRAVAAADEPGVFVPLELEHLHRQATAAADQRTDPVADDELAAAFPGLAAARSGDSAAAEEDPAEPDDEELARQMANLSPRAAAAVRAAADAETDEEREAALAAADQEGEPLNRGLLLKFLSSVKS